MTDLWDPKANNGAGGLVPVPETVAKDALSAGLQLPLGMPQYLVRPDGTVVKGVVTKDNADQLAADLRSGARFATQEEMDYKDRELEYGDQALKAGLVSAANEATVGALGAIASSVAPSVAKDIRNLAEFNPTATMVGGIGGALAPALFTGGASLEARGLAAGAEGVQAISRTKAAAQALGRGLGHTPAGLLTRAAVSAENAALGKGISRAAARVIGMGVEGTLYGGIGTATEDALQNRELSAESIASGMVLGGLLGAGAGYASKVVPNALGKAGSDMKSAVQRIWQKKTGTELADGVAELTFQKQAQKLNAAGRKVRADVMMSKDAVDAFKPKVEKLLNELQEGSEEVMDKITGASKRNVWEKLVPKKTLSAEKIAELRSNADSFVAFIDDFSERPETFKLTKGLSERQKNVFYEFRDQLYKATASQEDDALLNSFMVADGMKRQMQKFRKSMNKYEALTKDIDGFADPMMKSLEDTVSFGDGGLAQADLNDTWHRYISNADEYNRMFLTATGEAAPYQKVYRANPKSIDRFMGELGTYRNSLEEKIVARNIELQNEFLEKAAKYTDMDLDKLAASRASGESAKEQIAKMFTIMKHRNQFNELASRGTQQLVGGLGAAGLTYAATGGDLQSTALGGIAGVAMNPAKRIRALALLDGLTDAVGKRAGKSAKEYVKMAAMPFKERTAIKAASSRGARAAFRVLAFDEYKKTVDAVRAYVADPETVQAETMKAVGADTADAAPGTVNSAMLVNMKALDYLSSKIPKASLPKASLIPQAQKPPPDAERIRFSRIVRALKDPETILDDLSSGRITKDAVDAVKAVYPSIYNTLSEAVFDAIQENPKSLPYQEKVRLSVILGMPLHPSMEPAFMNTMDKALKNAPSQAQAEENMISPSQVKVPDLAGQMQTDTQRVLQGGY